MIAEFFGLMSLIEFIEFIDWLPLSLDGYYVLCSADVDLIFGGGMVLGLVVGVIIIGFIKGLRGHD